jgi:hypothetical protein
MLAAPIALINTAEPNQLALVPETSAPKPRIRRMTKSSLKKSARHARAMRT